MTDKSIESSVNESIVTPKPRRGRPPKAPEPAQSELTDTPKPRRGRPPKAPEPKASTLTTEPTETQPQMLSKDEIRKAKELLARARQEKKDKPKRKCTEKQLAALAAGRAKNPRLNKKKENSEV